MDAALIQTLEGAASQNIEEVKRCEEKLREWEMNCGFYPKLLDVYLTNEVAVNVRWMAIICLKNGINKYWRRVGKHFLTEEEKTYIRNRIIYFNETTPELALQLAVVIGRIARSDIKLWPEGLHKTLEGVKSENELAKHRALLTLNQIAKELVSKRLASDRRIFQEISANIFELLQQLCYEQFDNLVTNQQENVIKTLELAILLTKILRRLLIYGAGGYSAHTKQIAYLQWCIGRIEILYVKQNDCQIPRQVNLWKKQLILHMKILGEFDEHHSSSILPILSNVTRLCYHFVMSNTNATAHPMLVIHCGNLLRSISRRYTKVDRKSSESYPTEISTTARSMVLDILNVESVTNLAHHLVLNYFPLTVDELNEWAFSPEEYVLVEAGESYKFLLRPCIETLFVGLFYEFKSVLIPFVINLIQEAGRLDLKSATEHDLLKICSIFRTVGLASYELFGDVDFDAWFLNVLLPIFDMSPSNINIRKSMCVVQEHVMWMIGEWVNVKLSKTNRVFLYKLISGVLADKAADLVLKLTTCKTLRSTLDDFDFILEDFAPFVGDIFTMLCQLLMQVEECDAKMLVLNTISTMVERVDKKVQQNAEMLLHYLPQLWQLSEAHNLLRGAVVNVLNHLMKGLGAEGSKIDHITLPIIHHSTSVDQPAHIYLLEDGLELWQTVMQNSAVMTSDLLSLYKNIFALFERASETLDVCIAITRSYLLVDSVAFIQTHSDRLSKGFSELLGNVKESVATNIAKLLKLIVQLQPVLFMEKFQCNVIDVFTCCVKDENYPPLMTQNLCSVACMVIHQTENFYKIGHVYSQMNNSAYDDVMGRLFDVWLDKTDCMIIQDRKLSAIALVSLLPHKIRFIADRFALILDLCVNVIYDLLKNEGVSDQKYEDSLYVDWSNVSFDNENDQSIEDIKEHKLLAQDPIYTVNLIQFVKSKLNETKAAYGEKLFAEAMETMDAAVANQLLSMVSS